MKHKLRGFGIVVIYDFIEAFLFSVLPARLELATVPLEVGRSNPLSYGNIFVLPARLELATLTFVA